MTAAQLKIRHVFVPFLLIFHGVLLAYFLVEWWLQAHRQTALSGVWTALFPVLATAISLYEFLRPRLTILMEDDDFRNGGPRSGQWSFYLPTAVAIVLLSVKMHAYLGARYGGLVVLNDINELYSRPLSRFYVLNHPRTSKGLAGYDTAFVTAKGGTATVYLRIACPLLQNPYDTVGISPIAWLAFEYQASTENRKVAGEAGEAEVARIGKLLRARFDRAPLDSLLAFRYLDQNGPAEVTGDFMKAVRHSATYQGVANTVRNPLVFHPAYSAFDRRNDSNIRWLLGGYAGAVALFLLVLLFTKLNPDTTQTY